MVVRSYFLSRGFLEIIMRTSRPVLLHGLFQIFRGTIGFSIITGKKPIPKGLLSILQLLHDLPLNILRILLEKSLLEEGRDPESQLRNLICNEFLVNPFVVRFGESLVASMRFYKIALAILICSSALPFSSG